MFSFSIREYPCDHYTAIINVTLMCTGCPRAPVHETALQLLQILDKRFFGAVAPLPADDDSGEYVYLRCPDRAESEVSVSDSLTSITVSVKSNTVESHSPETYTSGDIGQYNTDAVECIALDTPSTSSKRNVFNGSTDSTVTYATLDELILDRFYKPCKVKSDKVVQTDIAFNNRLDLANNKATRKGILKKPAKTVQYDDRFKLDKFIISMDKVVVIRPNSSSEDYDSDSYVPREPIAGPSVDPVPKETSKSKKIKKKKQRKWCFF